MPEKLLRRPEVLARLGIATATLYDWLDTASTGHKPDFPRPVTLSVDRLGRATMVAWRETDINAWIASLADSGNAAKVSA